MKIIAVTSCATGIAHSYMSAEAIKKAAKAKGHSCKVEIQGALGIENQLSKKDIDSADLHLKLLLPVFVKPPHLP